MSAPTEPLFGRLTNAVADDWTAYTRHAFVEQLGSGALPEACFRHYLVQDYVFLIHFARAWGLAVYKARTLDDMRAAAETTSALLDHEMELHVSYCAEWGISLAELEAAPEARANMAYTRFVLERGLAGDVLDLHVALAPCVIGYAEIGSHLADQVGDALSDHPYRDWIEMYAGAEYQTVARQAIDQLDRLAAVRMGPQRFDELVETFRKATQLEIGFWQMGLDRSM